MKTLHEKASYIACGGNYQPGSVRYNRVYARAEQEIGKVMDENERLRAALERIAAFDDIGASKVLESTGNYKYFDEPHSVKDARDALKGPTDENQ